MGIDEHVDPHWRWALSYLKIGLRAVHHALSRGQAVFSRLTLQGDLTLGHQVGENAFLPLHSSPLKSAGSSFSVLPHKICQAAKWEPTVGRRRIPHLEGSLPSL